MRNIPTKFPGTIVLLSLFVLLSATKLRGQTIVTIAGTGTIGYSGDGGAATAAMLRYPQNVVADVAGNVYIGDAVNNCVRKIDKAGIISTIAGTGTSGFSGDGGAATAATFNNTQGIAVDATGNVYVADYMNNRVRKISTSGIITTIAGAGTAGHTGDGGAATLAELFMPYGIHLDASGNLYIAEEGNCIRKVTTSGIITTIAGTGVAGFSGDGGPATAALLHQCRDVAVDAAGNVYIADLLNRRIRKVNTAGIISTFAGTGNMSYSGDGGQATATDLCTPAGVAVDAAGNVYIVEAMCGSRIRKVNSSGIVTTVAGMTTAGYSGDGGDATLAQLYNPSDIAIDGAGNMYIADTYNQRIRKVPGVTSVVLPVRSSLPGVDLFPNPSSGIITISAEPSNKIVKLWLTDISGKMLYQTAVSGKSAEVDMSAYACGVYILKVQREDGIINELKALKQ
jgi:trimeric autotransporter adhesin